MELITEAILIGFAIVLAILFIPILIGMGIAALVQATGIYYFEAVFLTAFIIWILLFIFYYWCQ